MPLSDELAAELKRWRLRCPKKRDPGEPNGASDHADEHDLVFPGDDGRPLDHGLLLRNGFYPALRRAKLRKVRFHDPRHTYASLLIAAGVGIKRVQALLGHSSACLTLDVYSHLLPDTDDGAAEKIARLISGSKTVAAQTGAGAKSLMELEAGVGIEPASTALQAAA